MRRTIAYVLMAFAGLVFWYTADFATIQNRQQTSAINNLTLRVIKLEQQQQSLRDALCHEANMRAIRPSMEMNKEGCIKFFNEISKNAEKSVSQGTFPENVLAKPDEPCAMPYELCSYKGWIKSQWDYWRYRNR